MRNTIKIIILLAAILLAIGSVFIYASTRIEPPKIPVKYNQYNVDLAEHYYILSKTKKETETELMYTILKDRIKIYESEGKITLDEKDRNLSNLLSVYTPLFLSTSFEKFNKSNWTNNNHLKIHKRVDELKVIKLSNNKLVLSKSKMDSLNLVNDIINNYNHAKTVANSTSFRSIAASQSTINNAKKYANDKYLSNCTELRNSLNAVTGKIAQSHYSYLNSEVEKLGRYWNFSKNIYTNTLVPSVESAIGEYENSAVALYNSKANTAALRQTATTNIEDAINFYYRQ